MAEGDLVIHLLPSWWGVKVWFGGKGFGIRQNSRGGWGPTKAHAPPPRHQVVAGEPAKDYISQLPLHLGGTICLANGMWMEVIYVTSGLTQLGIRCMILHTLPLSASWVTPGLPYCSRLKQLGSLSHSWKTTVWLKMDCDSEIGVVQPLIWLQEEALTENRPVWGALTDMMVGREGHGHIRKRRKAHSKGLMLWAGIPRW